jgi:hypothetical protein
VHDTILLSSDPVSEMSPSPVPASRINRARTVVPPRRRGDDHARLARHAQVQRPYDHQMPYNNFVPPQAHPLFLAQPSAMFPPGHGMFLPHGAHPYMKGRSGPAVAFAPHGFNHYPMPMIPMLAQPNYQPYQRMMPPSFPPDSWLPMPNSGLPPVHKGTRNPYMRQ